MKLLEEALPLLHMSSDISIDLILDTKGAALKQLKTKAKTISVGLLQIPSTAIMYTGRLLIAQLHAQKGAKMIDALGKGDRSSFPRTVI